MSRHKKNFSKSKTTPQSSPFGPKMAQNDPKKAKNQKVRKQKSYKMKVISLCEETQTIFFGSHHNLKIGQQHPKKSQNDPQKQKVKMSVNKNFTK